MLKLTSLVLLLVGVFFGVVSAVQAPQVNNVLLDVANQANILLMWVIQSLAVAALIKYLFE
ncbi:MAG TPA: hypothetical protein QF353_02850 [Gammaproteobacteria bacterium]|nr:hypothetical protein [Gammaproteobacteria bacterium]